jgi:hypothetical protein
MRVLDDDRSLPVAVYITGQNGGVNSYSTPERQFECTNFKGIRRYGNIDGREDYSVDMYGYFDISTATEADALRYLGSFPAGSTWEVRPTVAGSTGTINTLKMFVKISPPVTVTPPNFLAAGWRQVTVS